MKKTALWACLFWLTFSSCSDDDNQNEPISTGRCDVDLAGTGFFSQVGSGSLAKEISSTEELVGGAHAHGEIGDFLLQNDKIQVVIQRPIRLVSANPYGGNIIDADLQRAAGQPGRDQFGELATLYAFGRTPLTEKVEVINDGSKGGFAVVAATGLDTVNDYMNIPNVLEQFLGPVTLASNPNTSLPLRITTYYVLSPGESRVRMLSAFCNESDGRIVTTVGDLIEQGGPTEFFNPNGCVAGMGNRDCLVDSFSWFGFTGDEVAYGYRTYALSNPAVPEMKNALLSVAGVVGVLASGVDVSGVLTWTDPAAERRPGVFGIDSMGQKLFLRDFIVGRDLGDIRSWVGITEGIVTGRLEVTVTDAQGVWVPNARVAVLNPETAKALTVLTTDITGTARVSLPQGNYALRAGKSGYAILSAKEFSVFEGQTTEAAISLGEKRTLTVSVRDPLGQPLPAKVTVLCGGGMCPHPSTDYELFYQNELLPSNVAAVGFASADGKVELSLPPGNYEVVVTRGPEYSAWPDTWPQLGERINLTSTDVSVTASLAQVVDTTGWMSADLHVHAVNSPDSSVGHPLRVMSFAAEGVDVLVATDHDVITDLSPIIESLGAQKFIASVIGQELTPFDFGHQNAFPLTVGTGANGGAFDWAGGEGSTMRLGQMYQGLRERFPDVVIQINHPRSAGSGSLTALKVDTATGASHSDPMRFRMEPAPNATPDDSKLFSSQFDALEVQNGLSPNFAVMNDWMTFLSRGLVKTATAVSDTHKAFSNSGGYSRTYIRLGQDAPANLEISAFAQAIRSQKAIGTNGPFLHVTATRLDASDAPIGTAVEVGDTLSLNSAAGEKLRLDVRIQAPEWLTFEAIEVYTHAGGRESVDGVSNASWPQERIHQIRNLDPLSLPLVPVAGVPGMNVRRIDVTESFTLTPTQDTWFVVMVRGGAASRSLFPMSINGASCSSGVCAPVQNKAFAYTNAILIDADNSGAYDTPPSPKVQELKSARKAHPQKPRVPTLEEFKAALLEMMHRH